MSKKPAAFSAHPAAAPCASHSMNQESMMKHTHKWFALGALAAALAAGGLAHAQQPPTATPMTVGADDQWNKKSFWDNFGITASPNLGGSLSTPSGSKDFYYVNSIGSHDAPSVKDWVNDPSDPLAKTGLTSLIVANNYNLTNAYVRKIGIAYLGGIALVANNIDSVTGQPSDNQNTLYTWGWNGQGQLGIGLTDGPVVGTAGPATAGISTSQWMGQTYGGGYVLVNFFNNPQNFYTLRGIPVTGQDVSGNNASRSYNVIDADSGYHHMIALTADDDNYTNSRVWAWGYNASYQVGQKTGARWNYPRLVQGLPANIQKVFANHGYLDRGQSFALTLGTTSYSVIFADGSKKTLTGGKLYAWGSGSSYKLGSSSANSEKPVQIVFTDNVDKNIDIVDVQGGDYHNMALDVKGNVWVWGSNSYFGDDGATGSTPRKLTCKPSSACYGIKYPVKEIAMSYDNALILDANNRVWQGGYVYDTSAHFKNFTEVQVSPVDVHEVGYTPIPNHLGAGEQVSYIIDTYGRPWSWGNGVYHGFGREGDYILSYTKMKAKVAHQFPQVIGDGDTQRTATDPTIPDSTKNTTDTPTDNKKFGTSGFNSKHPTIYDAKYESATNPNLTTLAWKALAFHPIPKLTQIRGSRSAQIMLDEYGNIWKWAYDGSGTIAWGNGDDYKSQYDNTGNGRDGLYDSYCYEVMLMRGGQGDQCKVITVQPNLMSNGSTSSVGGSSTRTNSSYSMVYVTSRTFAMGANAIGGWMGQLVGYAGDKLDADPAPWNAKLGSSRQIFTASASQEGVPFELNSGSLSGLTDADVPNSGPTSLWCTNEVTNQDVDCSAPCMVPDDSDPSGFSEDSSKCSPKLCPDPNSSSDPPDQVSCQSLSQVTQADINIMRKQPLGDIVNSQLVYVGAPTLLSLNQNYLTFAKAVNKLDTSPSNHRPGVVYVMANDGMLHGFDAGNGIPNSAPNNTGNQGTGAEKFAYVPRGLLANLRSNVNNTASQRWVDGGVFSGDAQLDASSYGVGLNSSQNPGHYATVLAGTLGSGARGYFALDVTNPDAITESSPANLQKAMLVDTTDPDSAFPLDSTDDKAAKIAALGIQTSLPVADQYNTTRQSAQITRINNTQNANGDEWAIIMGNGFDSTGGVPVLLIQSLSEAGRPLYMVKASCTLAKPGANPGDPPDNSACIAVGNGLGAPRAVDVDGNGTADFVYAGDLLGNLWKFDISSTDPTKWSAAYGSASESGAPAVPMFTAVGPDGKPQPITSAPVAVPYPNGGFMVGFGTGKNLTQSDLSDAISIDSKTQAKTALSNPPQNSFYALYDQQGITISQVKISEAGGLNTLQTKASVVKLLAAVPPSSDKFCNTASGSNRYASCLYQRDGGGSWSALNNTDMSQALTNKPAKGNIAVGTPNAGNNTMKGWYYDIPLEMDASNLPVNGHAPKVLDNPAMMDDQVVQFFSVNLPVVTGDPGTSCAPTPGNLAATDEVVVFNYFDLFTGGPSNTITIEGETTESNRFRIDEPSSPNGPVTGKYVRSGANAYIRAAGGQLIQYNPLARAGRRAGWRTR
ncbi:MAG: hypothetical protein LBI48_04325 [Burkholderiaceae bacterium]|jgi:alpha-tubulin suppressor-like RCC1 family protein|nr:hypothetical protein [Burkholderiaceae bacterium]